MKKYIEDLGGVEKVEKKARGLAHFFSDVSSYPHF